MDATFLKKVVCVVGPTASGKTALAQEIALQYDGEVLSADSMQIYKGMNIGTGKISSLEMKVKHYGLDLINPGEEYSASLFQTYGRNVINSLHKQNKTCVVCGGTGFYIRALIDDYDFPKGEQKDNPIREKYTAIARTLGNKAVWDELDKLDHESAACIHPNNVKRVIRALEMHFEGVSYANQLTKLQTLKQAVPAIFIGLSVPREVLNERIDKRVDEMIKSGLVEEVEELLKNGFRDGITAPQAIGYKEIVQALDGLISMDEAIQQIKIATHRYAKRQRSWFNKDTRINWIDADKPLEEMLQEATRVINENK